MKYCRKCGMLLEDTYSTCIRCGTDVTIEKNVSLYPPEVMDTIDAQNEERKKRIKITMLIIAILIALVGIVAVAAVQIGNGNFKLAGIGEQPVEEYNGSEVEEVVQEDIEPEASDGEVEEVVEDMQEVGEPDEATEEEATEAQGSDRVINDAKGSYYNIINEKDDAGNVVLTAIIPEDFGEDTFSIDYEVCSTKYPIGMLCSAGGEDGGIQFLYMGPKQLWYKLSETGKTRSNERDPSYYMSFLEYGGAKAYIESMLAASYPKGKFNCVSEEEISPEETEKIKALSDSKTKKLFSGIGDYAHIGEGTTYANMDAEYSALVYEYEITTSEKQTVFDKFYVPVISNNLYYANETNNDRGTVTEWYVLGFCVMEAGNEDLYDDYEEAFELFALNAVPTEIYMKVNQLYGEEIEKAINAKRAADPLTIDMLKNYTKEANGSYSLNDFNSKVWDILSSYGSKSFTGDDMTIHTGSNSKVVFVDKEKGKLYVSPDAQSYPGDAYTELTMTEGSSDSVDDNNGEEQQVRGADDSRSGNDSNAGGGIL